MSVGSRVVPSRLGPVAINAVVAGASQSGPSQSTTESNSQAGPSQSLVTTSAFTTPFISTQPVSRLNISIPQGEPFIQSGSFNRATALSQQVKSSSKTGKKNGRGIFEHHVAPPRYEASRKKWVQEVFVLLLPYLPGVTEIPDGQKVQPYIYTAFFPSQLQHALRNNLLIAMTLMVSNVTNFNMYHDIYTSVAEHTHEHNLLIGGAMLPIEPPVNSPPLVVCDLGRVSNSRASIRATSFNNVWTSDKLNGTTAFHNIKLHHDGKLVIILAPTGMIHAPIPDRHPGHHPCFAFRFMDEFVHPQWSAQARPSIDCIPECPGFAAADEMDDTEEREIVWLSSQKGQKADFLSFSQRRYEHSLIFVNCRTFFYAVATRAVNLTWQTVLLFRTAHTLTTKQLPVLFHLTFPRAHPRAIQDVIPSFFITIRTSRDPAITPCSLARFTKISSVESSSFTVAIGRNYSSVIT
ncbi:hypothetical protein V5O48_012505 [Marasmius crinis-equi]|uniref:Uncharacterized protein n=1 Tax=Marasmius crinis-equi TaxID=585013 RepID=A0ABR3F2N4_9AGAR